MMPKTMRIAATATATLQMGHLLIWVGLVLLLLIQQTVGRKSLTSQSIHRTQAAQERVNDLWCYDCDTMSNDGESCVDVVARNGTTAVMLTTATLTTSVAPGHVKKCKGEEFVCMVKRFSYTTSTENSTSSPKMWSLARRCAVNCEPGCIIIGERTKLYACTSCCEKSLCNVDRGAAMSIFQHHRLETGIGVMVPAILCFLTTTNRGV